VATQHDNTEQVKASGAHPRGGDDHAAARRAGSSSSQQQKGVMLDGKMLVQKEQVKNSLESGRALTSARAHSCNHSHLPSPPIVPSGRCVDHSDAALFSHVRAASVKF